jgi:hypothetical protein
MIQPVGKIDIQKQKSAIYLQKVRTEIRSTRELTQNKATALPVTHGYK